MYLSIIIPTYKRADDLQRLLQSVSVQTSMPEQVIIVVGPDDKKSLETAGNCKSKIPGLEIYESPKASVVYAMNLGLSVSKGEIIAFLDDDAYTPSDWSLKIRSAYRKNEQLGAYGGRDYLQLNQSRLANPPLAKVIGIFGSDGILKGNHHCGSLHSPVQVDVLKGVNLSFRRSAFPLMKIEEALEGFGAETCWEIDICQQIKQAGYEVIYDNDNYVLHYVAQRTDDDDRTDIFSPAWPKRIYNQALVIAKFRPATEMILFFLKSVFVGGRKQPGILYSLKLLPDYGFRVLKLPWSNASIIIKGEIQGLKIRKKDRKSILITRQFL